MPSTTAQDVCVMLGYGLEDIMLEDIMFFYELVYLLHIRDKEITHELLDL